MKFTELLQDDPVIPAVNARIVELTNAIRQKTLEIKKAPAGRLRLSVRGKGLRCYCMTQKGDVTGTYISQKHRSLAFALAQKMYDDEVLAKLRSLKSFLEGVEAKYKSLSLDSLYEGLSEPRQRMVQPVRLPDEAFAERWLSEQYEGKDFAEDVQELRTASGVRVRSKSEVIIAETLERLDIPYRYEFPHELQRKKGRSCSMVTFYPDFTCLNRRTHREYIWEHFGLMDEAEYVSGCLQKQEIYEANGFFVGENLIFTMESKSMPLNPSRVDFLARKYLL